MFAFPSRTFPLGGRFMHKLTRRTALKGLGLAGGAAVAGRLALAQSQTREVPWLLEIQQPPERLPPNAPKLRPILLDAEGKPISSIGAWNARREELRRWWLDFLGPMPAERGLPPKLTVVE